jgi:transcription antitermination factor NusG
MIKHPRTAGFHVGDTVRVTAEDFKGQIGELKVIDMYQAGDYFGVYLESTQSTVFFCADEIEKVEIR